MMMVPTGLIAAVELALTGVFADVTFCTEGENSTISGEQLTLVQGIVGSCDSGGEASVVTPVAGIGLPAVVQTPSKVADEPNMLADEVPNVVHGTPLPGIAIVPVGLIGAGLFPADVISVAPSGMPVPPTVVPLLMSSGEVVVIDGVGMTMLCAATTWPATSRGSSAAISFTDVLHLRPDWLALAFAKTISARRYPAD
jgi:hypothetical protein